MRGIELFYRVYSLYLGRLLDGLLAQRIQLLLGLVVGLRFDLTLLLKSLHSLLVLPSDLHIAVSHQANLTRASLHSQAPHPEDQKHPHASRGPYH